MAGNALTLSDVYGNPINSTAFGAYTSGGIAARIFTLTTIYAEADLVVESLTGPAERTAVALRYVVDAAYAEVASVMGTSEEAARRNVHEGLKRLRTEYAR